MSKILIIPDVHGRTFWEKATSEVSNFDKIIFLGDYLDPYPDEKISKDETLKNFKKIITFKEENNDKIILLIGNHDAHYFYDITKSSRYNRDYKEEINKYQDLMQFTYQDNDYLFTHAGVLPNWCSKINLEEVNADTLNTVLKENPNYLDYISRYRGGIDSSGSIIWADVREHFDNKLKSIKYYQIFGHTWLKSPIIESRFACLDCQNLFKLENNKIEIYDL